MLAQAAKEAGRVVGRKLVESYGGRVVPTLVVLRLSTTGRLAGIIRAIKCTLGMDVLRCKTPEMVRKEIWTCLLPYNLIRRTMLQAAIVGQHPKGLRQRHRKAPRPAA